MRTLSALILLSGFTASANAQMANIGKPVNSIDLLDAKDNVRKLQFGQKVTAIFYTDPDAKDVINPLSEAMEQKGLPKNKAKFIGIGVINCKDTWMPNAVMRAAVRQKEKDEPGSVILFDKKRLLSAAWGLGDCDDACMLVIVGADAKVKYARAIKSQDECRTIIAPVIKILEDEIAKVN